MPPGAYKTFRLSAPLRTHWRPASCADAGCPYYLNGWKTVVDESTDLGQRQAHYIRRESGRRFTEDRNERPGLTTFVFEPGQECFAAAAHADDPVRGRHVVRNDRPARTLVHDGDWRAAGPSVERHPDDFTEEFVTHQNRLKTLLERG